MIYKILLTILITTVFLFLVALIYAIHVPYPNKYTDGVVSFLLQVIVIEVGLLSFTFLFFGV